MPMSLNLAAGINVQVIKLEDRIKMSKLHILFLSLWITVQALLQSSGCAGGGGGDNNEGGVEFKVGVVLDLESVEGSRGASYLSMALSDFYETNTNFTTRLLLHVRDSNSNVLDAAASALSLLKDVKVDAILIGPPQTSSQANFLMDLGDRAHVPVISFSATATSPPLLPRTPYFLQTAPSADAQVAPLVALIKAFQWRQVVIIYEDTEYGHGHGVFVPYLANALQEINAQVSYRSIIPLSATDDFLLKELYKMMTMQTRVFVVHMSHSLGSRLFLKAKEIGMMSEGYAWIITSGLTDLLYSFDSRVLEAMQGVLGVKPRIPKSKKLDSFAIRWKRNFLKNNIPSIKQISIFGLWAYDTIWALAMAAERVGSIESESFSNATNVNSTNPFSFGISQTGPKILKAMLEESFEGLGGEFRFVNRRLQPSKFRIINITGKRVREVGIWTLSRGISRKLASGENTLAILWPGESRVVPKGWDIPVSGKKLKIGVPVKDGFTEFVKVERDPLTHTSKVSGYCIAVFDSVMKALPYAVPYEYIPFANPDGSSNGTYNDLVHQVFLKVRYIYQKKFDAAVGDITITAKRSVNVDFTLPYAEGGVSMIVPTIYEDMNSKWAFLKPLKTDLWLTSIAFFILTGFVVWILEHRINTAFRGPPSQQVGMILWFPFSTLVFAHRESIVSNFARLVVVVWIFVVLILNSSYTASLSSRLTIQRLRPTVASVEELIKNGDYVGHEEGSFIADHLKAIGFSETKLKPYKSASECNEGLLTGTKKGGISAFFATGPHTKLFLSQFCQKYMIVGSTYQTDGFALVFQKDSPLIADVSRSVLKLTESNEMVDLQRRWLGYDKAKPMCTGSLDNTTNTSNSLSLKSFEGLFAITGSVTTVCLLVFLLVYFYKNKDFLQTIANSNTTAWSRIWEMWRHFDRKDLSSYPFNRTRGNQVDHQFGDIAITNSSYMIDSPPSLARNSDLSGIVSSGSEEGGGERDANETIIICPNSGDTAAVEHAA